MTPAQWEKIESVLQAALDLPRMERVAFLDQACEGDSALSEEVRSLADAYEGYRDFMEEPALVSDAEVLFGSNNVGKEIGPYKIDRLLGFGGMGEVYLAEDQRLERQVALKILPAYFSDDSRLNRFRKEARAASGLNHPNIITIYEVGEQDDLHFIATEFIEGETLRELINRNELTVERSLDIAEQVCSALVAAHDAGIIHRDIKPENIMCRPDGIVKLLDFGIAKLIEGTNGHTQLNSTETEVGSMLGTVNYMSPEQARGVTIDERTDVWSLGVVIYEMVAHQLPFSGATRLDTLVTILERNPEPISAFPIIQSLIEKCLAKDPEARFQNSHELLTALKDLKVNQSIKVPEMGPQSRLFNRIAIPLVIVLLTAMVSVFWYRRNLRRPSDERRPAAQVRKLYSDMTEAERLTFIDEQEQRISMLMGERPSKLNADALHAIKSRVDKYAERATVNEKGKPLSVVFERAQPFLPLIGRSFKERKVPVILGVYLAMIESEYQVCYENPLGSKGLFQFLPGTAAHYGVSKQEMCDADKMTPAAAHYLADRMAELGDDAQSLTLVLLSYTTGEDWVRSTLRNLREKGNYDRNFWTMFDQRNTLGSEFSQSVAGYVPSFFAAAIVGENPRTFGIDSEPLTVIAGEPQQ